MAKVLFVVHPYNAPTNVKGNICRWNTTKSHWRKVIYSEGAHFIDLGGCLQQGNIAFVGEWECCSELLDYPVSSPCEFEGIHLPFLTTMDDWRHILSTDPFVHGPKFYHSCCKIGHTKDMAPGDIVLFGSYKKDMPGKILLDTVMVLAERIDLLEKPEYCFPYGYSHVTLSRLHPDDFVWDGKMYDVKEPGTSDMFSFVPCRPVSSLRHPAPIDVPCVISDTIWGSKLSVGRNAGPITVPDIKKFFDALVKEVKAAGFSLGVRMPMPAKRELYDIVK